MNVQCGTSGWCKDRRDVKVFYPLSRVSWSIPGDLRRRQVHILSAHIFFSKRTRIIVCSVRRLFMVFVSVVGKIEVTLKNSVRKVTLQKYRRNV